MFERAALLACAAIAAGSALPAATPAQAGEWSHHGWVETHRPWYDQHPWTGTGPGYYYSNHPNHIPAYPKPLRGYPVPLYEVRAPLPAAPRFRASFDRHAEWCARRYRSYDVRSDTFQPYHGPRRYCRSPFG